MGSATQGIHGYPRHALYMSIVSTVAHIIATLTASGIIAAFGALLPVSSLDPMISPIVESEVSLEPVTGGLTFFVPCDTTNAGAPVGGVYMPGSDSSSVPSQQYM